MRKTLENQECQGFGVVWFSFRQDVSTIFTVKEFGGEFVKETGSSLD